MKCVRCDRFEALSGVDICENCCVAFYIEAMEEYRKLTTAKEHSELPTAKEPDLERRVKNLEIRMWCLFYFALASAVLIAGIILNLSQ